MKARVLAAVLFSVLPRTEEAPQAQDDKLTRVNWRVGVQFTAVINPGEGGRGILFYLIIIKCLQTDQKSRLVKKLILLTDCTWSCKAVVLLRDP